MPRPLAAKIVQLEKYEVDTRVLHKRQQALVLTALAIHLEDGHVLTSIGRPASRVEVRAYQ